MATEPPGSESEPAPDIDARSPAIKSRPVAQATRFRAATVVLAD